MARLCEGICTAGLGEYKDMGFKAYESDDDFLVLEHEGQVIGSYNVIKVEIEALQRACHQHLNEDLFRKLNDDKQPCY